MQELWCRTLPTLSPAGPRASGEKARVPARACPRVLGASAASTTGFCSQMQLPFVPAPLAAVSAAVRQTRTSCSKAATEAEQRSHRHRSQPVDGGFLGRDFLFHQYFSTISPPLQQQHLHFTAMETEAIKVQKGEESPREPHLLPRSFERLSDCSGTNSAGTKLKCKRVI